MARTAEGMSDAAVREFARTVALDRLAERDRSRAELAEALVKRKVPLEVASELLDKLESSGLLDDARFAQSWVQARQRGKGLAPRVLAQELRRKGIDDEVIREAVADIDPDDQRQAAHLMVQRKLRSMRQLDDAVKLRRLVAMLARKGYSSQLAVEVVREELGAEQVPLDLP